MGTIHSAEAVADDLQRWLDVKPIRARPTGSAERLWKWGLRHRARASALLALMVLAVGAIVAIAIQWRRAETARADLTANLYYSDVALAERELSALGCRQEGRPSMSPSRRRWMRLRR